MLATTRVAKRPSGPVRNTQHKMRDLDVQVRYAMTWDDKVAPMSVNILREFMRSLCSAEEHLPKSFSRVRFVIYTNDLSHDRVATWLHRVPSNGSSSDARRLLNIDRLPFPRRAFGDFTSWLERRDKSRKPGQQPRRNWFGPLRVDDYASVRRLLVDLYTSEPSSAYLYIGADTVFVRPPALLAARAHHAPNAAFYMLDNFPRNSSHMTSPLKHGVRTQNVLSLAPLGLPACAGFLGDFFFVPRGMPFGENAVAESVVLLQRYVEACESPRLAERPTPWCLPDSPIHEPLHGLDQYVWSLLLARYTHGACHALDDAKYDSMCGGEPYGSVEVAHGHASCKVMQNLPLLTAPDVACKALTNPQHHQIQSQ